MPQKGIKSRKSQYKCVQILEANDKTYYVVNIKGYGRNSFETEREAAIAVDKIKIKQGKEPVNILKRKDE